MIKSLRGRLFVGLTLMVVLTGAVGGAVAYWWAYSEAIEMQDSVLIQIGALAIDAPVKRSQAVQGVDAESEVVIVELGDAPRGAADNRRLWSVPDGLHNETYQHQSIRALLRTRADGNRFAVTQRTEIRSELAADLALHTLYPIAALVPCLMLVIAFVIGRSLGPMVRLAKELDARKADELGQLTVKGAPSELQPFLVSINGLLERLRGMLEQQRRFIADAAHELRTPITALGLQAENLETFEMPASARDRLAALRSGMRRTKHMLEQLLMHARQDLAVSEAGEMVHLDAVAKGVVADLLPEAAARHVDLGFTLAEDIVVAGSTFALTAAMRNLIENAVKFTPDGGSVDLGVYQEGEMAVFQIDDTGPGIPESDLERIFEPFFRGRASGDGAGLGLSIVKRIVDRSGGAISVENVVGTERSGLRVTIKLRRLTEPVGPSEKAF